MILTFTSVAQAVENFGAEIVVADVQGASDRPTVAMHDADGWLTFEGYAALTLNREASK